MALMPTYVILMNWTDQGARADRDAVRRRKHADAVAENTLRAFDHDQMQAIIQRTG
jgi:uncharacterized protein with GYD domain